MRIMLNGRSLAGKDKIGEILCEKHNFKPISFAQPIYKIASDIFGMNEKDRSLLISIGQKMREINQDVWIDYLLKQIADSDDNIVITDVRQANEYIKCREAGFLPVRVTSSLANRIERCKQRDGFEPTQETLDQWESEGEVGADNFTYVEIRNDFELSDLESDVDYVVKNYEKYQEKISKIK